MASDLKTANIILYCANWEATVAFYRDGLGLPVHFENDWFVEFILNPGARLSVADERRASVKTAHGKGITVTLELDDIDAAWEAAQRNGLSPDPVRNHPWNARVFYLIDPEGHRIEFWQSTGEV